MIGNADGNDTSVYLGGTLQLTLGLEKPNGTSFMILDNRSMDDSLGDFSGLAEGSQFTQSGQTFTISYVGGDGNDVVLTSVSDISEVPEASTWLSGLAAALFLIATGARSIRFKQTL